MSALLLLMAGVMTSCSDDDDTGPFSSEAERGWGSVVSSVSKVVFNHLQSIEGIENV